MAQGSTGNNDELDALRARVAELEPYEAAVATLAADMDRDGAVLLSDIRRGDRFCLARRFRSVVRAKLEAQQHTHTGPTSCCEQH
jgi:hypothetical protein